MSEVAEVFGVTPQTVRNWVRAGHLSADRTGRRWVVDRSSCDAFAASRELQIGPPVAGDRLDELEGKVTALAESFASVAFEAASRERDRYRAEAAAAKEAALKANAAAEEMREAVRRLLDVLDLQSGALTQLLAPGSPEDLASGPPSPDQS